MQLYCYTWSQCWPYKRLCFNISNTKDSKAGLSRAAGPNPVLEVQFGNTLAKAGSNRANWSRCVWALIITQRCRAWIWVQRNNTRVNISIFINIGSFFNGPIPSYAAHFTTCWSKAVYVTDKGSLGPLMLVLGPVSGFWSRWGVECAFSSSSVKKPVRSLCKTCSSS